MEKEKPLNMGYVGKLLARWRALKASGKYPMTTTMQDLVEAGEFTLQEAQDLGSILCPPTNGTYYTGMN